MGKIEKAPESQVIDLTRILGPIYSWREGVVHIMGGKARECWLGGRLD